MSATTQTKQKSEKPRHVDRPTLPEGIEVMLVGSGFDGYEKKAFLKFYDPVDHVVYNWLDHTGHQPYCYTKQDHAKALQVILTNEPRFRVKTGLKKYDVMNDEEIDVIKITTEEPKAIGGRDDSIRLKMKDKEDKDRIWEGNVRYTESYLYDRQMIVGTYYIREGNEILPVTKPVSDTVKRKMKFMLWDKVKDSKDSDYIMQWANLLNQPVPEFKRLAVDIEVEVEHEGVMPSLDEHDKKITAIGFWGSDGFRKVLVLYDENKDDGSPMHEAAEVCFTELEMIQKAFEIMRQYPMVLTFNGDEFDFPYLHARAFHDCGIDMDDIPVAKTVVAKGKFVEIVFLKHGIHIDLMRFFSNKSLQNYAFGQKYKEHSLEAISRGLLKEGKEEYDGDIKDLSIQKLSSYCLRDAELTCKLTTYGGNAVMKLLVMVCRIGRGMPMDDVSRHGVSQWIRSCLYAEHRLRNELIPTKDELELKGTASTTAKIKDKKYAGGEVMDPLEGLHFDVIVLDFASLYPSILKNRNLSYETINCFHEDCRANTIPGTQHWVCGHRKGLTSLLIGSLRDLRVNYYKHLAKDKQLEEDERNLNDIISQALKVIMNASYGVIGYDDSPLYCLPVADATTAVGRFTINSTIDECRKRLLIVIYGDTDSVFLKNPPKEKLDDIIVWAAKTLGVDLEVDKHYRWVVFSTLKKNYVGIKDDGTEDIKGLTGKKSNTPPFIRSLFRACIEELKKVHTKEDFEVAKKEITTLVQAEIKRLENREIDIREMIFKMTLNRDPQSYGKELTQKEKDEKAAKEAIKFETLDGIEYDPDADDDDDDNESTNGDRKSIPQHARAALQMIEAGIPIKAGQSVAFVKMAKGRVKALQFAKKEDPDINKYKDTMESVLDQLLAPLDLKFEDMVPVDVQKTGGRQKSFDELLFQSIPNPKAEGQSPAGV